MVGYAFNMQFIDALQAPNSPAIRELDCPCPTFGSGRAHSHLQLLALMGWLGVAEDRDVDACTLIHLSKQDGMRTSEIARSTGYAPASVRRLAARSRDWIAQAGSLDVEVASGTAAGEDILEWSTDKLLVSARVSNLLSLARPGSGRSLSLRELCDQWPVDRLLRQPNFSHVSVLALARSIELVGAGKHFLGLMEHANSVVAVPRKQSHRTPHQNNEVEKQEDRGHGHTVFEFIERASEAQATTAWGVASFPWMASL